MIVKYREHFLEYACYHGSPLLPLNNGCRPFHGTISFLSVELFLSTVASSQIEVQTMSKKRRKMILDSVSTITQANGRALERQSGKGAALRNEEIRPDKWQQSNTH
jgi:hypothetical protein